MTAAFAALLLMLSVQVTPQVHSATFSFYGPYYSVGEHLNADGSPYSPDGLTIAAPPNLYWLLGRTVVVTVNGRSLMLKVADKCPGCPPAQLDLPDNVWASFGQPFSRGILRGSIVW